MADYRYFLLETTQKHGVTRTPAAVQLMQDACQSNIDNEHCWKATIVSMI